MGNGTTVMSPKHTLKYGRVGTMVFGWTQKVGWDVGLFLFESASPAPNGDPGGYQELPPADRELTRLKV